MNKNYNDPKITDDFNKAAGNPPTPYEAQKGQFQRDVNPKNADKQHNSDKFERNQRVGKFNTAAAKSEKKPAQPETIKQSGSAQVANTNLGLNHGPPPPTAEKNAGARAAHNEALANDAPDKTPFQSRMDEKNLKNEISKSEKGMSSTDKFNQKAKK